MTHAEFFNRTARGRAQFDPAPKDTVASGARLSQPQRLRRSRNGAGGLRASVDKRACCGWDSRAPTAGSNCTARGSVFQLGWLLLLLGLLGPQNLFSQTAPAAARPSNRWLLIIETSRAMQPRAEAIAQIAANLVLSGMSGQLHTGDTLGVWTFNSDLHAGSFPLQTVTPDNTKTIAERVALFVAQQKFEGWPGRDKVFPAMNSVISNSEFITVILVSGGGETFAGTPFDKAINAIHKKWQGQQDKARLPFLTMLRAQHGRTTDFEVSMPPGPLNFPPLPAELLIPDPIVEKRVPAKPVEVPPAPIVPNLILHGKKPEPVLEAVSNPAPASAEKTVPVPPPTAPTNAVGETKTNPPVPAVATATKVATNLSATNVIAGASTNQIATTTARTTTSEGKNFWLAGAVAALAAAGLVFVLFRRARSQPRVSLITRSLDRDKK